ncbi:Zn-dependent exopeptidase [Sporormia fimetaria CBS 119925]|uniref:Peptide hydrolase n=1 Tax=Sporormia fimetaria CBS 119925 TaxID=1340428 RepID=A0A6A6V0E6_9PLEO|nr:Zn-dependent exopeptidase [Sporormia fimetaria CBS 119925]
MKFAASLVAAISASSALALPAADVDARAAKKLYTVETGPGEIRQVTDAEKWALKKQDVHFFDITDYPDLTAYANSASDRMRIQATFPSTLTKTTQVRALIPSLSKTNMQTNLQTFSAYYNRYYRSATGKSSSEWLLSQVQAVIRASGATRASARAFTHSSWTQNSIIATIPGKTANTIVLGAHLDSVGSTTTGRSPGADDDGSGCMTILETMRVLLSDATIKAGQQQNTIEFHWYAAEEGGLLGSQAIFNNYRTAGKVVKAMLNQDMTGYVPPNKPERFGVITDNVDAGLTTFAKRLITGYTTIPSVDSRCGYACSDHASATRAGFPAAFVFETAMEDSSPYIHSAQDTVAYVNFDHMIQHARLSLGFAYELGFATTL